MMGDPFSGSDAVAPQRRSRKRVIFSCSHCRLAKLKCDRKSPCTQCGRRGRSAQECVYEPLPTKMRKSRSIAAKLDQIQNTVHHMMQASSGQVPPPQSPVGGRVVIGEQGKGNYIGATHFMTVLDDLEDLRQFFDNSDSEDGDDFSPAPSSDADILDTLLLSTGSSKGKESILRLLPPLQVLNRLVMRYFAWHSPSSNIIHRPTFNRNYLAFRQHQAGASFEFLALLFMILAEATLFSSFSIPEEIAADNLGSALDRVKTYRSAGVSALSAANYTSPSLDTMVPLLLHLEAEFVFSRSTPMRCYLLSSTCIRLMLRLGLHRDPSSLPDISVFLGEMRRRMWHFGLQIEMIVSFQMGLPSMSSGIWSDTDLPRNLTDQDLHEDIAELPASRADSADAPLTYFNWKTKIGQIFGLIAKRANLPDQLGETEVRRLDDELEDMWRQVPDFLKVRSLEESITDDPLLVMQRFSIGSIYHKSKCVLHRQYLRKRNSGTDPIYSHRICVHAALTLLEFQKMHHEATRPGAMLAQFAWFLRPLLIGDFSLAAMIVYIALQNKSSMDEMHGNEQLPNNQTLFRALDQSRNIWESMAVEDSSYRKTASLISTMTAKARLYCGNAMVSRRATNPTPTLGDERVSALEEFDSQLTGVGSAIENGTLSALEFPSAMAPSGTSIRISNDTVVQDFDFNSWLPSADDLFDWRIIDERMRFDEPQNFGNEIESTPASLPSYIDHFDVGQSNL